MIGKSNKKYLALHFKTFILRFPLKDFSVGCGGEACMELLENTNQKSFYKNFVMLLVKRRETAQVIKEKWLRK